MAAASRSLRGCQATPTSKAGTGIGGCFATTLANAAADVGAAPAAVAAAPSAHARAIYTLTAPAAYTGDELAAALSAAAGRPVRFVDVAESALRDQLLAAGADRWTADGVLESYGLARADKTSAITEDVQRLTGVAPIDFPRWAREHAAAFS